MPRIPRSEFARAALGAVKQETAQVLRQVQGEVAVVRGWVANAVRSAPRPKWEGIGSAGQAGWLAGRPPPVRDATARFNSVYAAAKAGSNTLPPEAKNYKYLVVGGLFTQRYPGYMDGNVQRLRNLGLDTQRVKIDTGASVKENAAVVREAILEASKSGEQVVLIGQSKGGVDVAAALAMYPELKPHVRAVVAMQAPYGGTPIASDLEDCPSLRTVVDVKIKDLLHADPRSLKDLSYAQRKAFVSKYPYPADIPTVSLATSRTSAASMLNATATYISDRYGLKSDGLVVNQDAEIPGSRVVRLGNMDHAESVMQSRTGAWETGDVTQTLVTLALEEQS